MKSSAKLGGAGWGAIAVLLAGTVMLNVVGLKWGLPNTAPWHSDSIAGVKTVRMIPRLWKSWEGERYPRGHFLIAGSLYKPFIERWEAKPFQRRDRRTGQVVSRWESIERISTLILVSRVVTVVMAAGAVLAVFLTVRLLCGDWLAGFLAGAVLMLSGEFTYFAHLGVIDVPATFWFAWAAYFTVRAVQSGRWWCFVLLGLLAGMVVSTKDASVGHVGGLAVFALGAAVVHHVRRSGALGVVKALIEPRLWVALGCFGLVFVLMNDILTDYGAFKKRLDWWLGVKDDYKGGFKGSWWLFKKAMLCVREDVGYWMYWGLRVSLVYLVVAAVVRRSWRYVAFLCWSLLPFLVFHVGITMGAYQVQPRYHLPSLTCLALAVGVAGATWLRWKRVPMVVRVLPVAGLFLLAGLYAVSVSVEMVSESRYKAEAWIAEKLPSKADSITFIAPPASMPRVHVLPCRVQFAHNARKTTEASLRGRPKLIAVSDAWYNNGLHFDREFRRKLIDEEQLGYRKIAEFGRWLDPDKRNIFRAHDKTASGDLDSRLRGNDSFGGRILSEAFHWACWKTKPRRDVSPKVVIMERVD